MMVLFRFEMILGNAQTSTMVRIKLYELLSTFIRLEQAKINTALAEQKHLMSCILSDFNRFQNNSIMLTVLSQLVKNITV